jgi:hypothetical protein
MKTQFTTKEEYLAYRSQWKAEYATLSQTIRDAKFCNWFEKLGTNRRKNKILQKRYDSLGSYHGTTDYAITGLKGQATNMLKERKASKVEAQRQYLEQKQQLVAA